MRKVHRKVDDAADLIRAALDDLDELDRDDLQALLTADLEELEETVRALENELDPDDDGTAELP